MVSSLYKDKIWIVYLQNLMSSLGYNMTTKILPFFLRRLTSSALKIGLVNSSYQLARVACAVPSGILGDKVGHRKTLGVSYIALCIFSVSLSFGNSIESFALLFFGIGLSSSMFYLVLASLTSTTQRESGEALSKLELMYQVGFVAGPIFAGFIATVFDMVFVFYIWSGLSVAGLLLVYPLEASGGLSKSTVSGIIQTVWSKSKAIPSAFVICLASIFVMGLIEGARDLLIPLFNFGVGLDIFQLGTIFSLSAIITALGIVPLGMFSDRYGSDKSLLIGFCMILFSLIVIPYASSLLTICLITGILSLGRTIGLVSSRAFMSIAFEPSFRTTALATVEMFFLLGRVSGPLISGFIADLTNIPMAFNVFFFVVAVFVISTQLAKILHK